MGFLPITPDVLVSLRHSPATLEEEAAPASSEVLCAASNAAPCQDECALSPADSGPLLRDEPARGPDTPLAPLGCAPITIPRAKGARVGSPPVGDAGDPAGLRVWTPATAQERRQSDILRAASQGSSASGSQETPAGVRLGTPAWTAWRRRQDLLRASSQESSASGAETPAGPAEGAPAWRVHRDLGRAISQEGRAGGAGDTLAFAVNLGGLGTGTWRNNTHAAQRCGAPRGGGGQLWPVRSVDSPRPPLDAMPHNQIGAARLAEDGTLGRAHSAADVTPATAEQMAALRHSHAEYQGGSGAPVEPWQFVCRLRTSSDVLAAAVNFHVTQAIQCAQGKCLCGGACCDVLLCSACACMWLSCVLRLHRSISWSAS